MHSCIQLCHSIAQQNLKKIIYDINYSGAETEIFPGKGQYHCYWCPGSLHRQVRYQQPWYWLCRINKSLSSKRKDFNYLRHVSVEKSYEMQLYFHVSQTNFGKASIWILFQQGQIQCKSYCESIITMQWLKSPTENYIPGKPLVHQLPQLREAGFDLSYPEHWGQRLHPAIF